MQCTYSSVCVFQGSDKTRVDQYTDHWARGPEGNRAIHHRQHCHRSPPPPSLHSSEFSVMEKLNAASFECKSSVIFHSPKITSQTFLTEKKKKLHSTIWIVIYILDLLLRICKVKPAWTQRNIALKTQADHAIHLYTALNGTISLTR